MKQYRIELQREKGERWERTGYSFPTMVEARLFARGYAAALYDIAYKYYGVSVHEASSNTREIYTSGVIWRE